MSNTRNLRLYRLSPRYQQQIHAKGRCAAGGQGAIGCGNRATATVFAGGPIKLGTCAEHEQQINEVGAWLASFGDPIPNCILMEFIFKTMLMHPDTACPGDEGWWLQYCREGTGCGHPQRDSDHPPGHQ